MPELHEIQGATSVESCNILRQCAARIPADQAIVELGVYMGRSVCYLGQGAKEGQGAKVWGIDPWDLPGQRRTYEEAKRDLQPDPVNGFNSEQTRLAAARHVIAAGLADTVTLVRGFAAELGRLWVGPPVALMYIDADHHEESILSDFDAWRPHFIDGALLIFDDYAPEFDGVVRAVDRLHESGEIELPELHGQLAITRIT